MCFVVSKAIACIKNSYFYTTMTGCFAVGNFRPVGKYDSLKSSFAVPMLIYLYKHKNPGMTYNTTTDASRLVEQCIQSISNISHLCTAISQSWVVVVKNSCNTWERKNGATHTRMWDAIPVEHRQLKQSRLGRLKAAKGQDLWLT